jgi:hypothetical protein
MTDKPLGSVNMSSYAVLYMSFRITIGHSFVGWCLHEFSRIKDRLANSYFSSVTMLTNNQQSVLKVLD